MKLKKMAVLAAVILTAILLSSTCYAQGDRPVKVDTSAQGRSVQSSDQGNIGGLTPAPKAPETTAKPPVTPVPKAAAPAPVQRVRSARREVIRERTYHTRTIREKPHGHGKVLHQLRGENIPGRAGYGRNGWNVLSESSADAKDEKILRQANTHTDKKIADAMGQRGVNPQGESTLKARRRDVPPFNPTQTGGDAVNHDWTPLLWLLALAVIAVLAYHIWECYFRGRRIENKAKFWANRRSIGERCAEVRLIPIERQAATKQVRNVSAGELKFRDLTDAAENGTDELEFRLENHNGAHAGIAATGVWVGDDLPEELVYKPGSGHAYINKRYAVRADGSREDKAVAIPDWMMTQMLDYGRVLRMNQIPGMPAQLGPRSAWFVVFRTLGEAAEEEDEGVEFIEATAEGGPDYVEPAAEGGEVAAADEAAAAETPEEQQERILRRIRGT